MSRRRIAIGVYVNMSIRVKLIGEIFALGWALGVVCALPQNALRPAPAASRVRSKPKNRRLGALHAPLRERQEVRLGTIACLSAGWFEHFS